MQIALKTDKIGIPFTGLHVVAVGCTATVTMAVITIPKLPLGITSDHAA